VDTDPTLPEYGLRSLAELAPSLLAALGLPGPNPLGIEPAGRVCLLLVDGLGAHQLAAHAGDAPFLAALDGGVPLSAGFPSSTPISLATLGSGAPPGAHGLLGLRIDAGGELLDTLAWSIHRAGTAVDVREELPPERVQPLETAFARAAAAGLDVRVVSARQFAGSGLSRAALRGGTYRGVHSLGDLAGELVTALAAPGPRFCYGYHAHLDLLGHVHGPGSLPWRLELAMVDRLAALVAEALPPDGLLVVTADHGMCTVPPEQRFDFDSDPDLRAGVRLLGGDARARYVYAVPGARDDVLAAWRRRLGEHAWVLPREAAIAEGWFGPAVSEAARQRIGDVVVAMRRDAEVVRSRAEPKLAGLLGQHGSLTAAEQHVPLLVSRAE
jgi:predicted AlkP superfamily pyrophosphatase or phosphodiesterase